ncbi:hypothetical protein [Prosthecobacter sp.]|uniref:hypothetical protein n=1 Tax=Prosthecobacter sp. TaxID=1965333 RepID=UPI0024874B1D|nr:hypothetical protein [Prosthecobacter sp.]MDI1312664.1 hypothetical protein [Prosthecobacter sp.]
MSSVVRNLPRITLLLAFSMGLASCTSTPVPSPPPQAAKPEHKKDYSALRIGGREELQLPGIGLIHADNRENSPGGEMLFSGRVFLDIKSSETDLLLLGKAHHAYAEKARWNRETGVLRLEGLSIVEFDKVVAEGTEAGTLVFFDRSGKITTRGAHTHTFY